MNKKSELCGLTGPGSLDFVLCSGSAYIELGHVVQTQAGQAAVHGFPVATAAVNIDDPIPMPDGEILVHPAGETVGVWPTTQIVFG